MEKKFTYDASEIFYKETGAGQPVVLLHGFAEENTIWQEQIDFLQEHCRVIVPDLPGSGKSALLQKSDAGIDDYAACINALLTNADIDKCILLGHSMGGYIAVAFAEKFAARLQAFGFVNSSAFADSEEKKSTRKKGIETMEKHGGYSFLKSTTPHSFSEEYKNKHPEKIEALIENEKNFSVEALVQYYTAMMNRPYRTEILEKSQVPVLFIIGSEDVAAPMDDLLKQVYLPKISHIHIIEGMGHMSMMEKPDQLNNYLLEFIRAVN